MIVFVSLFVGVCVMSDSLSSAAVLRKRSFAVS